MYPWLSQRLTQLIDRLTNNSLHHALLVQGLVGIGKKAFGEQLSQFILCKKGGEQACGQCQSCMLYAAQSHPDMHRIVSEKQIGVDLIRDAIKKLTGTAQLSGNKVLLIEKADTMTESAANALLKTLEEPTNNTFILLLTAKPDRLLATIKSRCEKVTLVGPDTQACIDWLAEQGHAGVDEQFVRLYSNAPLRVLDELEKDSGVTYEDFIQGLNALQAGAASAIELSEKWQSDSEQIVVWLQHQIRTLQLRNVTDSVGFEMEERAIHASQALINPGVNRILILAGLLTRFSLLNSKYSS
ncbi:DNA polymerase III subunit delta' [Aliiglaciecola sp. LCG003]|uniref:DNA polymerase III subunit delta' n=1 Tax=Aliiglaciecola sp. LCG003 TaxID=3053655 RepID=UPI0025730E9C|nr:DNA polymerase III subunit delta' [Aliiglaciecola sp. LCG003]WJG07714.1 DNA polymerase III subunit delta' [Aliiglaciecola sp. LCG003]